MKRNFLLLMLVTVVIATGCSPSTNGTQEVATNPPPLLPSITETATQTDTPISIETSTPTPEPTSTNTPTITPTATPNMVMPGTYYAGGCGSTSMSQGGQLVFCVNGITVNDDSHMIFGVTWTLSDIPSGFTVTKRSDQGNKNMYLTDNLGNRYDHIAGGDAAYASVVITDGDPVSGWLEFGQPPVGAFSFNFHDDDNGIIIGGISLSGSSGIQAINYKDFLLDEYPLLLQYQEELWQPSLLDGQTILLANKKINLCSVRAVLPEQPKGEHKSTIPIGEITYEIYGYFDDAVGLFIREYIYVSGITGVDPNMKPFFLVTIPSDNTTNCILDASNLLSTLAPKAP